MHGAVEEVVRRPDPADKSPGRSWLACKANEVESLGDNAELRLCNPLVNGRFSQFTEQYLGIRNLCKIESTSYFNCLI